MEGRLLSRWCSCLSRRQVAADSSTGWWRRLVDCYTEKHRHYHTLHHLDEMFHHLDEHKELIKDVADVELASFFHDIIYDPKSATNEEDSAALFSKFAEEIDLKPDTRDKVAEWILVTKKHRIDAHVTAGRVSSDDLAYFLDMDMAVLGRSWEGYQVYARQIRQEYSHVPSEEYRRRRAKVLENFLETPNIFATQVFRDLYEENARTNLRREIEEFCDKSIEIE